MIVLEHVGKVFEGSDTAAVGDLSLEVPEGTIATLVGPSGCGKSTTLRMINRLIDPTTGRILVNGRDIAEQRPHELRQGIGYVIQQIGLFPHRTIAQNIATVPQLLGWGRARIDERVDELLSLVGLDAELLGRYPAALSGGQQQRVGVARALAADPPVLLMDEPFGAVDPIVRGRLQDELLDLQSRLRKTIVFVTHDIDEAIHLGDRVAVLAVGGVLEQYAPPGELLEAPANEFVARFLGAERGLKRLSLLAIRDYPLDPGPTVGCAAPATEARSVMAEHGTDWVAVLDGGSLLGWLPAARLEDGPSIPLDEIRPFAVTLRPSNTLREALDALVLSPTRVAVVVNDEGEYQGMLDVGAIGGGLGIEAPTTAARS